MLKVLGGDGTEYGPVSVETLRQWVQQGRVGAQTLVKSEGATEWQPLSTLPELAALFPPPTPGTTPAMGGSPVVPAPTSGMAITSLVLGVLGCTAPLGLILGFVALRRISASQGRIGGRGLALAGVIVSASVLALAALVAVPAALLLPALSNAKSKALTINCVNNVKQIGLAVRIYSSDNNDTYPAATNWCDAILQDAGTPRIFQCPGDSAKLRSGYAFNKRVGGLAETNIAPDTVMIFESDAGWNASGGRELMITKPRHGDRFVVGLADGSVQQVTSARLSQLRWEPGDKTNNSN